MRAKFLFLVTVFCLLGTSGVSSREEGDLVDGCQYQPHQICYNFIIYGDGRSELEANIGVNIYEVVPPEE